MNEYRLGDLFIGMRAEFSREITEDMLRKFLEISGDQNPLHHDPAFAELMGFPNKVVFGMLTASLLSTLGGCYLPGKFCLIQEVEAKFIKPVFVGDKLTVTGEISEIYEDLNRIVVKVLIFNQNRAKVLRGKLKVGMLHE